MVAATGGNIVTLEVCGPMGETVNAFYGLTGDGKTAVIEMAAASGLMLVAPEKDVYKRQAVFVTFWRVMWKVLRTWRKVIPAQRQGISAYVWGLPVLRART